MSVKCEKRTRGTWRRSGSRCQRAASVVIARDAERMKVCRQHAKTEARWGWAETADPVETREEKIAAAQHDADLAIAGLLHYNRLLADAEAAIPVARDRVAVAKAHAEAMKAALEKVLALP